MARIAKEYVVRGVESSEDGVILELVEYEAVVQPKVEPIPKEETEKAVSSIFKAMEKFGVKPPQRYYPPGYEPHKIRAFLSMEDYVKLGKPTVQDQLRLTVERVSSEGGANG